MRAAEIFNKLIDEYEDVSSGGIYSYNINYVGLDGHFTAEELIYIAICMKTAKKIIEHTNAVSKEQQTEG